MSSFMLYVFSSPLWAVVIITSIWMSFDARELRDRQIRVLGTATINPGVWFLAGLLLWVVVFPRYLVLRSKYARASDDDLRRLVETEREQEARYAPAPIGAVGRAVRLVFVLALIAGVALAVVGLLAPITVR